MIGSILVLVRVLLIRIRQRHFNFILAIEINKSNYPEKLDLRSITKNIESGFETL